MPMTIQLHHSILVGSNLIKSARPSRGSVFHGLQTHAQFLSMLSGNCFQTWWIEFQQIWCIAIALQFQVTKHNVDAAVEDCQCLDHSRLPQQWNIFHRYVGKWRHSAIRDLKSQGYTSDISVDDCTLPLANPLAHWWNQILDGNIFACGRTRLYAFKELLRPNEIRNDGVLVSSTNILIMGILIMGIPTNGIVTILESETWEVILSFQRGPSCQRLDGR